MNPEINENSPKPCPACGGERRSQDNYYCKPCRAAYLKVRRHLGLHEYDSNASVTERRNKSKALAIEKLGGKCNRCGWKPEGPVQFGAMHFHHTDRDREWNGVGFGMRSPETIAEELSRCELLCVRCHVLEHAGEKVNKPGRPRKSIEGDERYQYFFKKLSVE